MERYHIYKLGLAILFYAVYFARQTVVNGLKIDDVTSTTDKTDYRERRDSGDDSIFFYQGADGTPGVDFPTLSYVPRTKFSCREMEAGYYADTETDCQVFHICDEGRKLSFLCPNGTVFQQAELICDWWFKVNCSTSPLLYEESAEILQKENAKRKDSRRLYHGTKQGVFSSKEGYDYEHDTIRGTPAHFVTPSYPYKSSLKTIDNRISVTTEDSIRRNYNARGDRRLNSFGNGVRERDYEKTSQFSAERGQNAFNINTQGKLDERGKATTSTYLLEASNGRQSSFGINLRKSGGHDQTAFDSSTSTLHKASATVGQLPFENKLQGSGKTGGFGQSGFGVNLQGKPEIDARVTFGAGNQQRGGSAVGQISFDRSSQQITGGGDQNVFEIGLQESVTSAGQGGFGTKIQGKFEPSGQATFSPSYQQKPSSSVGQIPLHKSSQQTGSGRDQNIFGTSVQGSAPIIGQSSFSADLQIETSGQATFDASYHQKTSSSVGQISLDRSSQQTGSGRGRNKFGTSLQESTPRAGQASFDANLQENLGTGRLATFGAVTQQSASSRRSQIPFDGSSQQNARDSGQNIFSTSAQGSTPSAGLSSFGISVGEKSKTGELATLAISHPQIPFEGSPQQASSGLGQKRFGSSLQGSALGPEQSKFGENLQDKLETGGQVTFDTGNVGRPSFDRNEKATISTNLRGKVTASMLTAFGGSDAERTTATSSGAAQEQASGTYPSSGVDKIKFSISSQGKSTEFGTSTQQRPGGHQQNVFAENAQNLLTGPDQTTVSGATQGTLSGSERNKFDVSLQGKSETFEQTTKTVGLKASRPTQNIFDVRSQREKDTDDGGKIPVLVVSAETQEPQESASFVKSSHNDLQDSSKRTTNSYPNHRLTYSDIKDPRHYYQLPQSKLPEKPFYGSSVSPQVLSTVPVSAHIGVSRPTTENYNFGFKTDISTKQPTKDVDVATFHDNTFGKNVSFTLAPFAGGERFSTRKPPGTTNRFSLGLNIPQTTKSSLASNSGRVSVDVSTSRSGLIDYNLATSTVLPQGNNYFDGKLTNEDLKESIIEQGISNFGQSSTQPPIQFATVGINKVDVNTYGKGFTNGVDVTLNSVSSTLSPDISSDMKGKSTIYPGSRKTKYFDEKLSTPVVGIDNLGFGGVRTTETNSPVIRLNLLPSTVSPGFQLTTRSGKAFNYESPKTQIMTLQDSKTKDIAKPSFDVKGNVRDESILSANFGSRSQEFTGKPVNHGFTSSSQTGSPYSLEGKANEVFSTVPSGTPDTTTGVGIRPLVSGNRLSGTKVDGHAFDRTSGDFSSTVETVYEQNLVSSTPNILESVDSYIGAIQNKPTAKTSEVKFTANNVFGFPTTDRVQFGTTLVRGRPGVDISTSTRITPVETESVKFTINTQPFTTLPSSVTKTIKITINNQSYSSPAPAFSATRQGDFDITTTTETLSKYENIQNVPYTSSSSILQPKPFSLTTSSPFVPGKFGVTEKTDLRPPTTPQVLPYTISSASPFATTPKSGGDLESHTPTPTLPTLFSTESSSLYPYKPTEENINNMINTLMEVVRQRFGAVSGDAEFGTPRPGLVVPPSVGPQTLHTLAIYFANALDNLTSSSPRKQPEETDEESGTNSPIIHIDNEELIKSLLTQMTRNNYEDLFKEKNTTTTELPSSLRIGGDDSENDLIREDTKHPTEGPGVRQLARVFTEALSAYLEDPDTFKKVLHDVRPTEPPQLLFSNETTEAEEDEVLNYSDSDLKSDHPHLPARPTGIPVSPTWGYILAINKSVPSGDNLESRNSLNADGENLQRADSQSFVSQFNKITQKLLTTLPVDTARTTEASYTETTNEDTAKTLPEDHWTTSSDVAKLWQTTLSINPAVLNENFDSTQVQGFSSLGAGVTSSEESSSESSRETTRVSEIHYELRSLPKIDLNSTQVHGILLDFMNASKSEGSEKLQRILQKLNISQDEFLNKMKEIEENPLTRRLILLLISECNTGRNKELETKAASGDSVFGLAKSELNSENTEQPVVTSRHFRTTDNAETDSEVTTESNPFKHTVHPSLDDDDEDTRALELLNSLYVIASKFGK